MSHGSNKTTNKPTEDSRLKRLSFRMLDETCPTLEDLCKDFHRACEDTVLQDDDYEIARVFEEDLQAFRERIRLEVTTPLRDLTIKLLQFMPEDSFQRLEQLVAARKF